MSYVIEGHTLDGTKIEIVVSQIQAFEEVDEENQKWLVRMAGFSSPSLSYLVSTAYKDKLKKAIREQSPA